MDEKKIEITLLTKEQVVGEEQIEIIKKIGKKCAVSDFVLVINGYFEDNKNVENDSLLKERTSYWMLSSAYYNEYGYLLVHDINKYGELSHIAPTAPYSIIRPVLSYSNIADLSLNEVREKDEILEVEYGEYPQYVVDKDLSQTLESNFLNGVIKKTGKKYSTFATTMKTNHTTHNITQENEEYKYNGKKYIRLKYNNSIGYILSNGQPYYNGDIVWLEVSPIKWIVDEKSKLLLSKNSLFSGIGFCNSNQQNNYNGDFKSTELYQYLNTSFAKDILSLKEQNRIEIKEKMKKNVIEETQERSQFQKEIDNILEEIKQQIGNFQKKEIIKIKVNNLLEEYNKKIESINKEEGLSLYSRETLKKEIIIKLTQVLDKLKNHNEKNKGFYNLINQMEEMIGLLKSKDKSILPENEKDIPLIKQIKQMMTICLPFINEKDSKEVIEQILKILEEEKNKLREYLIIIESQDDEILFEETKKIENSSVKDFEILLKERIIPILISLKDKIDNNNEAIKIQLSEMIEDIFENSKDEVTVTYLNEANKLKENILQLLLEIPEEYEIYQDELNKIIRKKIDNTKKTSDVLKEVQTMILSLYNLETVIKEKIENKKQFNESKIISRF